MRVNFSGRVSKIIADRAGYICSHYGCLTETRAAVNKNNHHSSAGISIAAHIYPASENGPRANKSISEYFIKSEKNGIWMCRNCAGAIDLFEDKYPAETLFEMKLVRECSQDLLVTNPDFRNFSSYLPKKRLDIIVRKYLPDPYSKIGEIKIEFNQLVQRWLTIHFSLFENNPPEPPTHFSLNKINAGISEALKSKETKINVNDHSHQISILNKLAQAANQFSKTKNDLRPYVILPCRAEVFSLEIASDRIILSDIELETDIVFMHYVSHDSITVKINTLATISRLLCVKIKIDYELKDGFSYLSCNLTSSRFKHPKSTIDSYYEKKSILHYISFIDNLMSGCQVAVEITIPQPQRETCSYDFKSGLISVDNKISHLELETLRWSYNRVLLGYSLSEEFIVEIYYTSEFFHEVLTEDCIRRSLIKLMKKIKDNNLINYTSLPIVSIDETTKIHVIFQKNSIAFKSSRTEIN